MNGEFKIIHEGEYIAITSRHDTVVFDFYMHETTVFMTHCHWGEIKKELKQLVDAVPTFQTYKDESVSDKLKNIHDSKYFYIWEDDATVFFQINPNGCQLFFAKDLWEEVKHEFREATKEGTLYSIKGHA